MGSTAARHYGVLLLTDHDAIVTAWQRRVRAGWGHGRHWHTIDGTGPLVREVLRGGDRCALLTEIGRRCGLDGHSLDDVTAWIAELLAVTPRRLRRQLDRRESAVALAEGWADGALERRCEGRAGIAPLAVLHVRVRQHYDQCRALGVDPSAAAALVVLDADTGAYGPLARAEALGALADVARATFRSGETVAAAPTDRLLVLAERSPGLAATVRHIVAEGQRHPLLTGCRVQGWVEPLARSADHLDAHLADLSR
jgi:hypothetical protein